MGELSTSDALWQFLGRLHPMLLHAPIGLLIGLVGVEIVELTRGRPLDRSVRATLAWMLALSAVASLVSGLAIADEGGYEEVALARHRLLGIVFAVTAVLLAALQRRSRQRAVYAAALFICVLLVIPLGHLGAGMTHGDDFLLAPFRPVERATAAPAATDEYTLVVAPILEAKCVSCHGPSKRKGKLALHTPEAIRAGGDDGDVIVPGSAADSLLIQRVRLPIEDEDHMPPEDKPQLTSEEIEALTRWIDGGARMGAAAEHTEPVPNPGTAAGAPTPRPSLPAAAISALQEVRIHLEVIDPQQQLVWIDASMASELGDAAIADLLAPLSPFVAELSLSGTQAGSATLGRVGTMPRLSRLDLSGTSVTSEALASIAGLPELSTLNVSRTALDDRALETLETLPALHRVHAWRSGISAESAWSFATASQGVDLDVEGAFATVAAEVEPPPTFTSDAPLPGAPAVTALQPTNATCPISGAPIDPRFAIVHDGRVIGFCCEKCVAKFYESIKAGQR